MLSNRLALGVLIALVLLIMAPGASAHDFDRHNFHPLRYIAYPFYAAGVYVEYTVIRPVHWLVSQPTYDRVFGHYATADDDHWEWRVDR